MKFINPSITKKIDSFFSLNKNPIGSNERLLELLDDIPQFERGKLNYIIAGSWAIEILSEKEIKHEDIDTIALQNPPYYIDDAIEIEEKCLSVIPLELDYLEKNFVEKIFCGKKVYVANHNLQICSKLIGQLQERLPERAIWQLKILLNSYKNFEEGKSQKEIRYILKKLTPKDLDHKTLSEKIINSTKKYLDGGKEEAINDFIEIHSTINKSLRNQFEKRGLTKKIKISEK